MQMKDVIRRKRKELDLTQEQMAEYLGVSAPAVNKWESGATYPDLSLVPALARLLKTDLNTLMCFHEDPTREEIAGYSRKVMEIYRWDYSGPALEFTVAMEEKDADRCVEILREMLDSLSRRSEMEKSILFTHIATKEMDPDFGKQIAEALLMAIERDDQYQFLREREDFQEILAGYARKD